MAEAKILSGEDKVPTLSGDSTMATDVDPAETREWLESLQYVLDSRGKQRAQFLLNALHMKAAASGVALPHALTTPYINTIPADEQVPYGGNREIERRIKSIVRWNAMAMVVRANKRFDGLGGHISTYASAATLYEVAFNHFFRGRGDGYAGDQIYFQGHASPGIYARAFVEGRLSEVHLDNFRRELQPEGGLSSYPHPWLMPDFWEFPTVSMGLGPIMAIYQARFNRYLQDRSLVNTEGRRVWAFLGDGECDEPETLGAIALASREQLDNLIFVINCNLQRLDGPVRGNGKVIQELEGVFRGAGWNVIKVIWGDDWDPLLEDDKAGRLMQRMGEVVDGQYQKYTAMPGSYIREHFFGKYPETLELAKRLSDEKLERMRRGGHDPEKVYAAYHAAVNHHGTPTVILAKTVKGYGLGEAGEGRNMTHQQKKLNEEELREFRSRFGIPISDEEVAKAPFYRPPEDSVEMRYLRKQRKALGGYVPTRPLAHPVTETPRLEDYGKTMKKLVGDQSTTMGFVRLLADLLKDKKIGKNLVPIVPDESRTFGMEGLFRQVGIYAHAGQRYEPVDSDQLMFYKEVIDGQILEEGITEAGSMASFIAAGTSYSQHGVNMIPFFIYYSMFGFQRIGDLIWAAADMRSKGFMLGATAGRTTLNGEGLQHQDGHSLLNAIAFPTVRAYDPAYTYETAVIVFDGMRRMYQEGETAIYYITLENEPYEMPEMPPGVEEGILKGIYPLHDATVEGSDLHVQLFGSGAILNSVLEAQKILAEQFQVGSRVWSVTSYSQLRRDAQSVERWNMLHPLDERRKSYLQTVLEGHPGPYLAASDYVRAVCEQVSPWVPGGLFTLGTDGLGRSDTREALRRHFEVDAPCVVVAALSRLAHQGKLDPQRVHEAIERLGLDREKANPLFA